MTAVNCILGSIRYSSLLPTPSSFPLSLFLSISFSSLFPLEHLELVAAQTIMQPLFWVKTTLKNERWTLSASTGKGVHCEGAREREVRGHRRCPFARSIIRLIWSSLKLWSISRFTAPKCRKFAHSFGSLVGNLSKSIIYTYIYNVLYTILYTYSNVLKPCHASFSRSSSQAKRLQIGNAKFSVAFLPSCGCHHKSKWRKVSWIKRIKGAARGAGSSRRTGKTGKRGVESRAGQATL